ncbi:LLM class F420-dependent oxidoreductase [Streptomyces sp. NPDC002577]
MTDDTNAATPLKQTVGKYGIWTVGLRGENPDRRAERAEAAAELEELGFGAIWLGGNSSIDNAAPLIEATSRIVVGTSIQSVWDHDADSTAAAFSKLETTHPGRFVLGLGVSHAKSTEGYRRPYATMVEYLDGLDKGGLPAGRRVIAALGPKMLGLARDRTAGSIPYLVTPEHTAEARDRIGQGPLLAPELKVVLETDPERARTLARGVLAMYLQLENYVNNWLRLGFTEGDVAGGGSDRLVDAVFAWGDESRIRERVESFLSAGADHVALQVVTENGAASIPKDEWRRLAALLK